MGDKLKYLDIKIAHATFSMTWSIKKIVIQNKIKVDKKSYNYIICDG